jgi:hypothetical protein
MTYFSDLHFFVGLQKSMKTKVYIKGLYNLFISNKSLLLLFNGACSVRAVVDGCTLQGIIYVVVDGCTLRGIVDVVVDGCTLHLC